MSKIAYDRAQLEELLQEALQTELGGIEVYATALTCALNKELREEWSKHLDQTRHHRDVLMAIFAELEIDPEQPTAGRQVEAQIGSALVDAMKRAKETATPEAAQIVACECIVLAETKDHANWELIGHLAKHGSGPGIRTLMKAFDDVEEDEDHPLYHTHGWMRELWIEALGFPAVLPPPEEVKNVPTAIGASRAEQMRDKLVKRRKHA